MQAHRRQQQRAKRSAYEKLKQQEDARREAYRTHANAESQRILEEQQKQDAAWRQAVAQVRCVQPARSSLADGQLTTCMALCRGMRAQSVPHTKHDGSSSPASRTCSPSGRQLEREGWAGGTHSQP